MLKNQMILGLAVAGITLVGITAADVDMTKVPPASTRTDVTFDKDIKPMFEKTCFKCHGAEKQKGKLRVDSLAAIKKGGENGEVFIVGKSGTSSLVHSISGAVEEIMPPDGKGDPLSKQQIGLVRAWIDSGAK